jgi:hypothetical protein
MAIALFITPEYIKSVSILDENVDDKIIKIAIKEAQDIRIHRILGTDLYNKYITDINVSSASVTGVYKTLMDSYILNALTYWTLYEIALFLNWKYRNKSIANQSGDNAQPAQLDVVQTLRDEHKDKAEWYSERLTRYLQENSSSYPQYEANTDGDDIQPDRDNYDIAIYTGNYGGACMNRPENRFEQ